MKKLILICGIMATVGCAPVPVVPNADTAQQTSTQPEQVQPVETEKPSMSASDRYSSAMREMCEEKVKLSHGVITAKNMGVSLKTMLDQAESTKIDASPVEQSMIRRDIKTMVTRVYLSKKPESEIEKIYQECLIAANLQNNNEKLSGQRTYLTPTGDRVAVGNTANSRRTAKQPITVPLFAASPSPPKPQAPPTKAQIKMCVDYAKEQYQWKDKESVRADSAEWSKGDGGPQGGILILQLNAKNGYGAYGGSNWTSCLIYNKKVISMSYMTKEGKML